VCFILGLLLMPETKHISIWDPSKNKAMA